MKKTAATKETDMSTQRSEVKSLEKKSASKETFRQNRHENDLNKLKLKLEGKEVTLKNWSRTGIGFELTSLHTQYSPGDEIKKIQLLCEDIILFEGDIQIRSTRKLQDEKVFYGAAFLSGLFMIETLDAATVVNSCVNAIKNDIQQVENIHPDFCKLVITLRTVLRTIKNTCEKEEARWKTLTFDQRCESEAILLPALVQKIKHTFFEFNGHIANIVNLDKLATDSVYHKIFHEEIYPFFEGADIIRRSYEKPRGYAGDYEMMNQIYRNGFEGKDLFGSVLHHYIANENSAESVKYRKPYFYNHYCKLLEKNKPASVLCLASGPATEFQDVVTKWDQKDLEKIEVTLFDLDREALEYAQTKIFATATKLGKNPNVHFINASVKSFLINKVENHNEANQSYDLIYSGGLFDYLDNFTSAAIVKKLYTFLKPGGSIVIGNFTKDNKTKAFLHLLTQWSLIHKTDTEMKQWAEGLEKTKISVDFDKNKMHAFLVITKNVD